MISSLKAPAPASVAVGLQRTSAMPHTQKIPEIKPMRRGRPSAQFSEAHNPSKSLKMANNDPFAALDSTSDPVRAAAVDELASRFPSLDEFSLLHDKGSKFEFSQTVKPSTDQTQLNEKVIEALADEAFIRPHTSALEEISTLSQNQGTPIVSKEIEKSNIQLPQEIKVPDTSLKDRQMFSTSTMTPQNPLLSTSQTLSSNHTRLSFRSSTASVKNVDRSRFGKPIGLFKQESESDILKRERPPLISSYRSKSFISADLMSKSPASSRPSLEYKRPTELDVEDSINRSRSVNVRTRPSSMHLESNPEHYQERKHNNNRNSFTSPSSDPLTKASTRATSESVHGCGQGNVRSDIDFLRVIEDEEPVKKRSKAVESRRSTKRSSLPASISNTKSILAGKFGDAFRKFESNNVGNRQNAPDNQICGEEEILTSITGSVNTDVRTEDEVGMDETEDLMPEVRREFERMRMQQEEKRVTEAAAVYRQKLDDQKVNKKYSKINKASTIQDHVKTLLQDNGTSVSGNPNRKASLPLPLDSSSGTSARESKPSEIPSNHIKDTSRPKPHITGYRLTAKPSTASAPPVSRVLPRPPAPPKPEALRSGSQVSLLASSGTKSAEFQPGPPANPSAVKGGLEAAEDWEANFNKRYPNLSRLDMVEM